MKENTTFIIVPVKWVITILVIVFVTTTLYVYIATVGSVLKIKAVLATITATHKT